MQIGSLRFALGGFGHFNVLVLALALAPGACHSTNDQGSATAESVGTVVFPLQSVSPAGKVYQLLGELEISGPTAVSVSTAEHTGSVLTQKLAVGEYTVLLRPDWKLVRLEAGESILASNPALISANPQPFTIVEGKVARVNFKFEVDGEVVLAEGDVEITLDVSERPRATGGSGGVGGSTGFGGSSAVGGSDSGGSAGAAAFHNEVFWEYRSSDMPSVNHVETLLALRDDPNTLLVATQTERAAAADQALRLGA